ncbi:hypothetical protein [Treponema vincentii]|nr:hypothetical protein [Treponema vincentii]
MKIIYWDDLIKEENIYPQGSAISIGGFDGAAPRARAYLIGGVEGCAA